MNFIDTVLGGIIPEYNKLQDKGYSIGSEMKMYGTITLVGGVALAVIGAVCCAASGFGVLLLLASVPFVYVGYNNMKMGENMQKMSTNIFETMLNNTNTVNLKRALGENTIAYDWMVDHVVHQLLRST